MNERLRDEHAASLARRLVEVVRPCLREEEVGDCFEELLALCRDELGRYGEAVARMERRLRPVD